MNMERISSRLSFAPHSANGFSLISAIFLLVILTALGAAIVTVTTAQHAGSALDVQGARAYQAARAGVEWGLYQRLQVPANTYCNPGPTQTNSFALPAGTTLSQFTVTVTCTRKAGASTALDRYQIIAIACNQPGPSGCPNPSANPDYVERQVQVEF